MKPKKAKIEKVFPQTWHRVDRLALVDTRQVVPARREFIENVVVLDEHARTLEIELTDIKGENFKGLPIEKLSTATAYFPDRRDALAFAINDVDSLIAELEIKLVKARARRFELNKSLNGEK